MLKIALSIVLGFLATLLLAQESPDDKSRAPRVQVIHPTIGAEDADPSLDEIRITFDMAMSRDGYSVVGGGAYFPSVTDQPRWEDAHTFVLPVRLKADHTYRFGLNSAQHRNFRSIWHVPLEPVHCHFRTGGTTAIKLTPEDQRRSNIESFGALADAVRSKYAYLEHRGVDWEGLFAEHCDGVVGSKDVSEWARRAATMLETARDIHMTLVLEGEVIPTYQRHVRSNFGFSGLQKTLGDVAMVNAGVGLGQTEDGFVYVLIHTWDAGAQKELQAVHDALASSLSAPGIIIDVRPNAGGSEMLARSVAAWFVDETAVYARHVFRRGRGPEDFTPPRDRVIEPNEPSKRYQGPVAVLMGPTVVSSCEAFLLMMKLSPRVTLIGERSFGSSGNPAAIFLPNGIQAMIPSWKALTADGKCIEGSGVSPDVPVSSEGVDFGLEDPVLEAALAHLRRQNNPSPAR